MLINFSVENFKSIDDLITFSMTLANDGDLKRKNVIDFESIELLKFAVIYGANASGKTNLLEAISFSRAIIEKSFLVKDFSYAYNRNSEENKTRKTKFEYDILIDDRIYSYGFSMILNEERICDEWLYDVTEEEIEIFTRTVGEIYSINEDYLSYNKENLERLNIYIKDIENNENILLLTSLNENKRVLEDERGKHIFLDIYRWFKYNLLILSSDLRDDKILTYHDRDYLEKLASFLNENDTGIKEVGLRKIDKRTIDFSVIEKKTLKNTIIMELKKENGFYQAILKDNDRIYSFIYENGEIEIYELLFYQNNNKIPFSYREQSDGTKRLVDIYSIIYNKRKKTFILDEIDKNLHPLVTCNFVLSFLNNDIFSQLIVTSHEDKILELGDRKSVV